MFAKYTVHLKTLLEDPTTSQAIEKAMSSYPLYEQKSRPDDMVPVFIPTREELNKKILDYYKYREIGFETPGRFIDELEIALNEIMPYYNQRFFSADQQYDIRYNVDYTRDGVITRKGDNKVVSDSASEGTSTSNATDSSRTSANTTSHNKDIESTAPQGLMDLPSSNADNAQYADKVTFNKTTSEDSGTTEGESNVEGTNKLKGNSTQDTTSNDEETHKEIIKGNYGQVSFQSLIGAYRELIINIEQEIINDRRIKELFMLVY